jgi:hypothetical protein
MTEPTLGNNIVIQVGNHCARHRNKARAWSEILGLPLPNIVITDTMDKTQAEYNSEPTPARAKLAFFHMGQLDVELIEPIDGPSTWKDQLDQHGDSLHHIAFEIEGMQGKNLISGFKRHTTRAARGIYRRALRVS